MRFTPRAEEYKAIEAMLESDEFDSATHMAKALVKAVAEMLWHRDWYAGVHVWDGKAGANYGPFTSESEVTSFGKGLGAGDAFGIVKLHSPARVVAIREGSPGMKGFCISCGHSPYDHKPEGSSRGACALTDCASCAGWKEKK